LFAAHSDQVKSAQVGEDGVPFVRVIALTPSPTTHQLALASLREELEATRHRVAELEGLLVELPTIFERKFQQQLLPVDRQHRLLMEENLHLREQAHYVLQGAPENEKPLLPLTGRLGFLSRRLLDSRDEKTAA
jgi:hypothetical protein